MEREDVKVEVDVEKIFVEESYKGPRFEDPEEIDAAWVESLMEWQKDEKKLHKKYTVMLINKAQDIWMKDPSLVEVHIDDLEEITVCGDIHGQYYDLLNIFKINGSPSPENPYVFNGDFVDRGSFSVEVITTLLAWKVCYPQHFFMNRGNHESGNLTRMYGFEGEVKHKLDVKCY